MTGSKGITGILVAAVLIILGVLFVQQRLSGTPTAKAPTSDTQPADTTQPVDTAQPADTAKPVDTTLASDAAPKPASAPSATAETQPQADTQATPQVDTRNWLCSAWQDGTGAIVTTGAPNNDTCTQWTIRRDAATE